MQIEVARRDRFKSAEEEELGPHGGHMGTGAESEKGESGGQPAGEVGWHERIGQRPLALCFATVQLPVGTFPPRLPWRQRGAAAPAKATNTVGGRGRMEQKRTREVGRAGS